MQYIYEITEEAGGCYKICSPPPPQKKKKKKKFRQILFSHNIHVNVSCQIILKFRTKHDALCKIS